MKLVVINEATHESAILRPEFIVAIREFLASNRQTPLR